ncbi:MAG: hypothetical protein EPN57_20985 [Paraburkholderia sp.]|nr:MAG: hypothetical protein EPN57_20985 [Paraburkholderia sp.]
MSEIARHDTPKREIVPSASELSNLPGSAYGARFAGKREPVDALGSLAGRLFVILAQIAMRRAKR